MSRLVLAAALPLAWHVASRMAGATLYDYASVWEPDCTQFVTALAHLLKTAFLEPWRYGFAYPIAAVAVAASFIRRKTGRGDARLPSDWPVAALAAFFCLIAFAFVCSLSRSADFAWHLESSAARLLWVPSLLVLSFYPLREN